MLLKRHILQPLHTAGGRALGVNVTIETASVGNFAGPADRTFNVSANTQSSPDLINNCRSHAEKSVFAIAGSFPFLTSSLPMRNDVFSAILTSRAPKLMGGSLCSHWFSVTRTLHRSSDSRSGKSPSQFQLLRSVHVPTCPLVCTLSFQ